MIYYIYKITDNTDRIYIGSTENIKRRINQHNSIINKTCSKQLNKPLNIEVLFEGEFDNKEDVENLEYSYIEYYDMTGNCINKQKGRKTKERTKIFLTNNKEKIRLRKKKYDEDNKQARKNYDEANKEKIRLRKKKYREDNKEKIRLCNKQIYHYRKTWGGDPRNNNNLLNISLDLFTL